MNPIDLHTHTVASTHAYSTIYEYVMVAKQKGIPLFANTDHGPELTDGAHEWHFLNLKSIPRLVDGVGILRGIESNIKNELGEIDCSPELAQHLDFIIAGLHYPLYEPKDKQTNTNAMINAMKCGYVHMISHPGNPKFPVDIWAVAEAAHQYDVAIEVNNSSFGRTRVGSEANCREFIRAVKTIGGWVALGSDSHFASTLGNFEHSLRILEEEAFPEAQIMNATPRRLLDFLAHRTGKTIPEFDHL